MVAITLLFIFSWWLTICAFKREHVTTRTFHRSTKVTSHLEQTSVFSAVAQKVIDGVKAGDGFKLIVADLLAGEVEVDKVAAEAESLSTSAPLVLFTWTMSPACKRAKNLLDIMGARYKEIRLDDPWDEGNKLRAVLGRKLKRTSVPMIFINGVYVGGCDDGPSATAPGIVPMAFSGKLKAMLESAGAIQTSLPADEPEMRRFDAQDLFSAPNIPSHRSEISMNNDDDGCPSGESVASKLSVPC